MHYMSRAIELAAKGIGYTSPNPLVGAVIVKDNEIIGEGYHEKAGADHAEIAALKLAGERAKGAALITNLEPCCHHGRTGPCTKAIIKAGIKEVHMAMLDPNPLVAGRGREELEAAGISTDLGELEDEARELNEVFIKYITTGFPFVAVKWAMTLDGKIATRTGESKWITSISSRKRAHEIRHQHDAILVGVNTIIKDNPKLTVRHEIKNPSHPVRVIVDSTGRTPLDSEVLKSDLQRKTILAATDRIDPDKEIAYRAKGAEVIRIKKDDRDEVDFTALLRELGNRKITSILIEGGGKVLASVIESGIADKAYLFISPKVIGGAEAKTPVEGQGAGKVSESSKWDMRGVEKIGEDVFITAYPKK